MKAYTLLILFSFIQVLFCDIEGLSVSKIREVFEKSLPYIKAFKPENIYIPETSRFTSLKFNYDDLTVSNTNFTIDEFNILHIKFLGLNGKISGKYQAFNFIKYGSKYDFSANLNNITFEQEFNVITSKQADGKYTLKYKKSGEAGLSFKVNNFTFTSTVPSSSLYYNIAANNLKNLNYNEFSAHLGKLSELILNNVATEIAK